MSKDGATVKNACVEDDAVTTRSNSDDEHQGQERVNGVH
jgi:hypothetical protein